MNKNILIIGSITILAIAGVVLVVRKDQTPTNQVINQSMEQQVTATPAPFTRQDNQPTIALLPTSVVDDQTIPSITAPNTEVKEFNLKAQQWFFQPSTITVNQGDRVKLNIQSLDVPHGIAIPALGIEQVLPPNQTTTVEFVASKVGTFPFSCSILCGTGHGGMSGTLVVK